MNIDDQGWRAQEAAADTSWIHRLSPEAVAGFDAALAHARRADKPLVEMTQEDFPLPQASVDALQAALQSTQGHWGMCQLKGFPVDRWSESDCRIAYWGLGLYMGVARTQNRASDILNDVRDAGGNYKVTNGRGYNTNAQLDFHCDSCDVVALLCRRTAKEGGASKIVSSKALVAEFARRRPDRRQGLARHPDHAGDHAGSGPGAGARPRGSPAPRPRPRARSATSTCR